jgi:hypothetical protein
MRAQRFSGNLSSSCLIVTTASTAVTFAVRGLRSQWMSAEIHLAALKVLSYAGMLTIAVIIDRDHGLDLDKLSSVAERV